MKAKYYIPNQHGSWAMLVIPFLFGMIASSAQLIHLLLFVCWLLIYLLMFATLQWIRTRRTQNYRQPILVYSAVLIPFAIWLIILKPIILLLSLLFIPLFIVNAYYAKRKQERAMLNDVAAIVQFSIMVWIAYIIGGGTDYSLAAELFTISVLYFVGTAFYVKTIIREKHNKRFYYYSVGYHLLLVILSLISLPWALSVTAVILLFRAAWFPKTRITVKQSGIMEIVYSVIILLSVGSSYV